MNTGDNNSILGISQLKNKSFQRWLDVAGL